MTPIAVFDLDGTLVDTAPDLSESLNHCLQAEGLSPVPLERIRPYSGHGSRVMLDSAYRFAGRTLAPEAMERQVARFLVHYEAHIADRSLPFPGAPDCLDRLRAAGFRLAVCTNKSERLARLLLEKLALAGRFASVCGGDTFAHKKPDPLHLVGTIERAAGDPSRAVMIGDTSTDTDAANAAGIPAILVDFGYAPDERARKSAAAIVADFASIDVDLVRKIIGGWPCIPEGRDPCEPRPRLG